MARRGIPATNKLTAERRRKGASKRRQSIAPAVRPGFIRRTGMSAEGAVQEICAGPSDLDFFFLTSPALTGGAIHCRRFAPPCSASRGKKSLPSCKGFEGK